MEKRNYSKLLMVMNQRTFIVLMRLGCYSGCHSQDVELVWKGISALVDLMPRRWW